MAAKPPTGPDDPADPMPDQPPQSAATSGPCPDLGASQASHDQAESTVGSSHPTVVPRQPSPAPPADGSPDSAAVREDRFGAQAGGQCGTPGAADALPARGLRVLHDSPWPGRGPDR